MKTDIVIVGAGVIGLAIAYELLCRGKRVTLVDTGQPGRAASWASAGVLAPQGALPLHRPYLDLCLASRDMFADWSAALLEETGIDVEYRTEGGLQVAFDDEESDELAERFRHQRELDLPIELLTGDEVRSLEPMLSSEIRCGLLYEGMHQVENRRLVQALVAAVKGRGGDFRIGNPATGLIVRRNRAAGVVVSGERLGAVQVVIAAGAWSGLLNWIPGLTPLVQPVRGQMVCVDGSALAPLQRVINDLGQYLVPRKRRPRAAGRHGGENGIRHEYDGRRSVHRDEAWPSHGARPVRCACRRGMGGTASHVEGRKAHIRSGQS